MNRKQLSRVENFTIGNKYGQILFFGLSDLIDVNLENEVKIGPQMVEVYPDENRKEAKPAINRKLNRQALLSLKGIKIKKGMTID